MPARSPEAAQSRNRRRKTTQKVKGSKTMNWVPIVLMIFKIGVLGATIFFSIKSHRDGEKEQERERAANRQDAPAQNAFDPSTPDLKVDG
ncbi:hypothetical protein K7H91_22415 [Martelella mediterranea]|uniref:hypothetical protein n=1 Tax=Martelella mediterranea TaxID=293089 RepID=UPI001E5DA8E6|nr:hypothetical protein [Martelella mediterranea]MCD1636516.1 hypothetical protein [Martelella mediterranea]